MREICQANLPLKPWMADHTRRLPGLSSIDANDWLCVDDVYAAQMDYRLELLKTKREAVYRTLETAAPAAKELLAAILELLATFDGFTINKSSVACPDGRHVDLDWDQPLLTAAKLVQEDLVLMEKRDNEHILSAAALCFPASWSLAEKFDRGLVGIHEPVAPYDNDMANRVQRMFDLIKPGKPMMRANFLVYSNPDLHQPREMDNRRKVDQNATLWTRVERQCLVRLPKTNAVLFSIHTYVVPLQLLTEPERQALLSLKGGALGPH